MTQSQKAGVVVGIIGGTVGGIAWLVLTGICLKSPLVILVPIIWGLVCVIGVIKLYNRNPGKIFTIMGLALLWLAVFNFAMGNIIYDKIPNTCGGMSTGKEQFGLVKFNIFLAMMSILGFFFIVRDISSKKDV